MTSSTVPPQTAWPVISLNNVTTDDVTASLGGGRPFLFFGPAQIHPGYMAKVDIFEDLDELDRLLDKGKAEVEHLRHMVRATERPVTRQDGQGS